MVSQSILVLSSHTNPNLTAPINHKFYCDRNGYDYLFDVTPYPITHPMQQKLHSIIRNLRRSNSSWIFWVDEDAYFMNVEIRLEDFIDQHPESDLIVCRSPINPDGQWSSINSGLMLIRNCDRMIKLFEDALATDAATIRSWWDHSQHGILVSDGSDQARITYHIFEQGLVGNKAIILDHNQFNSRSYDFQDSATEHFVCHLASHRDKSIPFRDMQKRFGLNDFLHPNEMSGFDLTKFRYSQFLSPPSPPKRRSLAKRAYGKLSRIIGQG